MMLRASTIRRRHGLTLIEVLLASGLAVFVLFAVGGAIRFYLLQVGSSQTQIEQAQLARAVLRLLENDLRSAVWKSEIDFSAVQSMAADSALGGSSDLDALADEFGLDPTTGAGDLLSNTQDLASSSVLPTSVGLYGNASELQIDISRVPRIDQYDPQFTGFRDRALNDIPSDTKTVTYFLLLPGVSSPMHGQIGSEGITKPQFGLVRRELDRAVTQYALNEGNNASLDASAEILAHEISMLVFRYYDGYTWYEEWDSEAMGGLPMAVDVMIAIRDHETTQALLTDETTLEPLNMDGNPMGQVFRRLVRIPIAQPYEEETATTDSTTEEIPL